MMADVETVALWAAAIGCGVMAGVYFAFSSFIMRSLADRPKPEGIAAMQAINRIIQASSFLPLFFGTTAVSSGLAVAAALQWSAPGSPLVVLGGALYVLGMFVLTAAFNVPLNDALDAVDPDSAEGASLWTRYLHDWTRYNHARTIASAVACGLFIAALLERSSV